MISAGQAEPLTDVAKINMGIFAEQTAGLIGPRTTDELSSSMSNMGMAMGVATIASAAASIVTGICGMVGQYYQAEAQKYTLKKQGEINDRQADMAVHSLNSKLAGMQAAISVTKNVRNKAALERAQAEATYKETRTKLTEQQKDDKAYAVDKRGLDITFSRMDRSYGTPVRAI
jgi:hypothetical protein